MIFHARRYIVSCVSLLFLPFSKYFLAQALSFVFTVSDNCSPLQTKRMVSFVLGIVLDPYNESSPKLDFLHSPAKTRARKIEEYKFHCFLQ